MIAWWNQYKRPVRRLPLIVILNEYIATVIDDDDNNNNYS